MESKLVDYLSQFAHENRAALFNEKIQERTNFVTLVLEDIYHAQNTSAAIRTCDCFGIQKMHVIENRNEFNLHTGITLGSANWIDIIRHKEEENNTRNALKKLKKEGYKIVATTPLPNTKSLYDMDLDKPIALVLGNEANGISDIVKEEADEFITIPMHGFTESFNISVSAAICLSELTTKMRKLEVDWKLNEAEHERVMLKWLKQSIKKGEKIAQDFESKQNP
ncbi:MAG: RNA methyltransferase [Flavobacteriales bacterium]